MITLYYAPKTRALRPRWLLEELNVPYELVYVDLQHGEQKSPEYLSIHPHGLVPALTDGNTVVFESGAICTYLTDKYDQRGLAPSVKDAKRADYYQWLFYAIATLEPALKPITHNSHIHSSEREQVALDKAKQHFFATADVLTEQLGENPYLLGAQFTTADIVTGALLLAAHRADLLKDYPTLTHYLERLKSRPAYQRAALD
jgi:glutathione S-transferase